MTKTRFFFKNLIPMYSYVLYVRTLGEWERKKNERNPVRHVVCVLIYHQNSWAVDKKLYIQELSVKSLFVFVLKKKVKEKNPNPNPPPFPLPGPVAPPRI